MRSLLLIFIFFTAIFVGTIIIVYESTKSSYEAVGYNNGMITTKFDIVNVIKNKIDTTHFCNEISNPKLETTVLITVKATALYATKYPNGLVSFCLAE